VNKENKSWLKMFLISWYVIGHKPSIDIKGLKVETWGKDLLVNELVESWITRVDGYLNLNNGL